MIRRQLCDNRVLKNRTQRRIGRRRNDKKEDEKPPGSRPSSQKPTLLPKQELEHGRALERKGRTMGLKPRGAPVAAFQGAVSAELGGRRGPHPSLSEIAPWDAATEAVSGRARLGPSKTSKLPAQVDLR